MKIISKIKAINLRILLCILIIAGLITIIIINDQNYKKQIKEKDNIIEEQIERLIKLNAENESLWNTYYKNVKVYDGEYYE